MSDDRQDRLEERLAFLERAHDELNTVVARQQLELERAREELRELRRLVAARPTGGGSEGGPRLEDDRPPHH